MKKLDKLLILLFFLAFSITGLFAESSVITIENAEKTSYRKNEETGNDEIILTGSVVISVVNDDTKVSISAVSVSYDRVTNMLFAQGNVTLSQSNSSEGGQNITADTLLFNTTSMEGIFDNGRVVQTQSDAINLPSDSTLIVSSSLFGRDSSDTVVFDNGELTFCSELNPHWKIKSSKIWLLPGGEFAFFNALLYVGVVPVLYLPAFYYPKDELVFNPVFGYNERKGYYTQTTTYILGRKPLDSSSSSSDDEDVSTGLYNFMKPTSLKEQVQEGLVLHNLNENYKGNTTNYLKVMGDYYSNLGYMLGLEGVYKPSKYISNIEGCVKLGFSNTIFKSDNSYSSISSSGRIYADDSVFLGMHFPMRFQTDFKFSMNKPFSLSLSLPVYSDPFFVTDFGTRSESMDWIGYLLSGIEDDDDDDTDSAQVSSFTWSMSGSYNQTLPTVIKPYISSLSISNFSSSVVFSSKNVGSGVLSTIDSYSEYSPKRQFYYPSTVTPIKISGKLAGTIFTTATTKKTAKTKTPSFSFTLKAPEDFLTEEDKADSTKDEPSEEKEEVASENASEIKEDVLTLTTGDLPDLDVSSLLSLTDITGFEYALTYSLTPQYTSQISYNSSTFNESADFSWDNYQSVYYQVKMPVSVTSNLSYDSSFINLKNVFSFSPIYQVHPNLNGYSESSANAIKKTDYNARKLDVSNDNSISFRPFLYNKYFKNVGLDWNSTVKIIRTNFIGDAENPEWEYLTVDLKDEECVTSHSLGATLAVNETDKIYQSLVLSTTLPPQDEEYTGVFTLGFPYVTSTISTGIKKVENTDETVEWKKEALKQSLKVNLFSNTLSFTESYNYNIESSYHDSLKLALSWSGMQLGYTMQYTYGYDFDEDDGWVSRDEQSFLPTTVSLAYSPSTKTYYRWRNRISFSPSVSTSVVYDCLRPTNSYFKFVPNLSFKINEFFNITFKSESRNSVVYRYFQKYTNLGIKIPGEENLFKDLFNSFKFWNDEYFWDPNQTARTSSGFKLKSLSVSVTHELCDWDLAANYTFSPRLRTDENNKKYYDFEPYFSIAVTWRPMGSIKTKIVDEYGTWELNP